MKIYGILGFPAKHSLSPAMHNAAFKALGIDARYDVFEIPENELDAFIKKVKNEPISGLSVTAPYKDDVIKYLDKIDDDAKKIGAVNTVMNRDGVLIGYNTDFIGATEALKETVGPLKDKKVVIVGAGGASKAIVYGLRKEGAKVSIFNRTKDKDGVDGDLNDMLKSDGDILIQTTSGYFSDTDSKKIFPSEFVNKFSIVMDIVYKPLITPLLKTAKNLGKKIIAGDKMLLLQGVEAFKLWTRREAPIDVMRTAMEKYKFDYNFHKK